MFIVYVCFVYIYIYSTCTCTCKQKRIKNKYYGSCHMAVDDLIITAKNNIFNMLFLAMVYSVFCQQSCLFHQTL